MDIKTRSAADMPTSAFRLLLHAGALALALTAGSAAAQGTSGVDCPQPRFTDKAPEDFLARTNPLQADAENLAAGARLFAEQRRGAACTACHGVRGDGHGPMSSMFKPPPRNFGCTKTINDIPDGQLFWVIKFGSPGTSMPPHLHLGDEDIWRLVQHLRNLARR